MNPARAVDVVVVGAGHNGLAMSAALARAGIEHVVLERGEPGQSWRTERWDSMRLLTPNWMTRLPGWAYDGEDPDGFMTAAEAAAVVARYAARVAAPVRAFTAVTAVRAEGRGYRVETAHGAWQCRGLVLASGAFGQPFVPRMAEALPSAVRSLTARDYRWPGQLDPGGVLVVGASASGVQLAREIHASGRPVTLAAGEHVRLPRRYRGRDIHWWMHASGMLDQRIEDQDNPHRARGLPSPQLAGTPERRNLDLNELRASGVEVVGRLAGIRDGRALFSGSLRNACALADLKMNRLLDAIDAFAAARGLDAEVGAIERFAPTIPAAAPRLTLDLAREVRTVIWATGGRPALSWLRLPVFERDGALRHDRGVVDAPGVCVLGLPFMRRRDSSFIRGCEHDVEALACHLVSHLRARPWPARGPEHRQRHGIAAN